MKIAVTGAFGYSGRYIAERLLAAGHQVLTLTNSVQRANPFGDRIEVAPLKFEYPAALRDSLQGADALINTYWVRFDHALFTHHQAVENTRVLFQAAKDAGVRRIVHVSITKPDITSELPYFSGKAQLEEHLQSLGIPFSILRPTVLFGREDVLINNIAWGLRHLPVFTVFGKGDYKLQPIFVDDLAETAAAETLADGNRTLNAIGPETFAYRELVALIRQKLGLRCAIVGVPPVVGYVGCRILGALMNDVVITREEIKGLMEGRLCVDAPPLGRTKLSAWIEQHRDTLGRRYTSELARRTDRVSAYTSN